MLIVYCRSHKRRPVRFGRLPPFRDVQADVPAGWCDACGREVYRREAQLCPWCQASKGELG